MALALIAFDFDPDLRLGDLVVGRQTVALAAAVLISVSLAAFLADRLRPTRALGRGPGLAVGRPEPPLPGLRRDHLFLILLAVVPGSVFAARIGYVLIHLDYYVAHPGAWLDLGQGSLELGFGVLGGVAAGLAMARAVGAPVGPWLNVWAVPAVVGLGLGKVAMAIGGAGQGTAADLPWATAYLGPGPWGSVLPDVPSHPAQIYEGVLDLAVAALIGALLLLGRFRDQDGRAFLAAITLWALARVEVGFVWRDPEVLGPFRSGQVVALVIAAASLALFLRRSWAADRRLGEVLADGPEPIEMVLPAGATAGAVPMAGAVQRAERASQRRPESWMPDRSGWLTAVRTTVEAATKPSRSPTGSGAGMTRPAVVTPRTPPAAATGPAAAPATPRPFAAPATPRPASAPATPRPFAAPATPRPAAAAASTPKPRQPVGESQDPPLHRRRAVAPMPDRSGWLTAAPRIAEPSRRPPPSGAEPRTSESSSSSSS